MVLLSDLAPVDACKSPLEVPDFGLFFLSLFFSHFFVKFSHRHAVDHFLFLFFHRLDLGFLEQLLLLVVEFAFPVFLHVRLDVFLNFDADVGIPELAQVNFLVVLLTIGDGVPWVSFALFYDLLKQFSLLFLLLEVESVFLLLLFSDIFLHFLNLLHLGQFLRLLNLLFRGFWPRRLFCKAFLF